MNAQERAPLAVVLPDAEVIRLLRRVAGARGLPWPSQRADLHGVGGFQMDLTNRPGRERVVWGTLRKDEGLLGLFVGERLVATADRGLGEVTGVQPLSLPGLPHLALLVDDRVSNLVGAFTRAERRRIYVWDGHQLREAFVGSLLDEQLFHARWENPRAPNVWRLQRSTGDLTISDGTLIYEVKRERLESPGSPQAPVPSPAAFRLIDQREEVERYRWNPRLRRFEAL